MPAQPSGLTATAGGVQATLTWDDPSDSSIIWYEYLQAQGAKLAASNSFSEYFGYSIAVDGDTAVVGAYGDDSGEGAAYVLTRQSGAWGQVAKLTASDADVGDDFGWSVAVDGDTVVVGAYRDDDKGVNSGSAYVFTKPDTGWASTSMAAKLTASDGAPYDYFGYWVAVDGDTVVVGAYRDDDNGDDSGSAYVFTKPADRRQLVLPAHCLNKTVTQRKWLPQIKCYPKSGRQSRGRRHQQDGKTGIAGDDPRPLPSFIEA